MKNTDTVFLYTRYAAAPRSGGRGWRVVGITAKGYRHTLATPATAAEARLLAENLTRTRTDYLDMLTRHAITD